MLFKFVMGVKVPTVLGILLVSYDALLKKRHSKKKSIDHWLHVVNKFTTDKKILRSFCSQLVFLLPAVL